MAEIKIPATPRDAYDPKRPANALLLAHVRELEKAVVDAGRTVRRKKPKTEGQVAAYIRHLNRALYQQVLLPTIRRRPLDVPLGVAPSRRSPKKKRPRRARRKRAAVVKRAKRVSRPRKAARSRRS